MLCWLGPSASEHCTPAILGLAHSLVRMSTGLSQKALRLRRILNAGRHEESHPRQWAFCDKTNPTVSSLSGTGE